MALKFVTIWAINMHASCVWEIWVPQRGKWKPAGDSELKTNLQIVCFSKLMYYCFKNLLLHSEDGKGLAIQITETICSSWAAYVKLLPLRQFLLLLGLAGVVALN